MKQIMSILAIGLILTGCTTIRVSTDQRKDVKKIPIRKEITFREIKSPTIRDPHLSLQAEVRVTEEETFQRKINLHRRLGKTGWLISTGIALGAEAMGYWLYSTGRVVLGRDVMGLAPIGVASAYWFSRKHIGYDWEYAEAILEPYAKPYRSSQVQVSVKDFSWLVYTDPVGKLNLDVINLAMLADQGKGLEIKLSPVGVETQKLSSLQNKFSISLNVVDQFRRAAGVAQTGLYKQPKFPADLQRTDFQFYEASGNDRLDAFESGEIRFVLNNKGRGQAQGLQVKLISLSHLRDLKYPKLTEIGNIAPGTHKVVKLPISAEKKLPDGRATFRVELLEHFGFDLDPFTLSFETKAFDPPVLVLVDVGIDDDKVGDSYGDNDGTIEPGESIEVTALIQNTGYGKAENVKAHVDVKGSNIFYTTGTPVFSLGTLESGAVRKVKFAIMINKKFNLSKLPVTLTLTENRGEHGMPAKDLNLALGQITKNVQQINIAGNQLEKKDIQRYKTAVIDIEDVPDLPRAHLDDALCIIIGVEEYRYAPIVTYANRDATTFYQYARKVFGIDEKNIRIVINEDATKGEFEKIFGENGWLGRRLNPGKTDVIIYYAGHGAPDIKSKQGYLIPYDIDPNYPGTGYSLNLLYKNLGLLKAKSVTFVLDACFSGLNREKETLFAGTRIAGYQIETPALYKGLSVFSAASGSEISSSYPKMNHGLFTYFFLKGLKGEADQNKDRILTLGELGNYVQQNVRSVAGHMDREQTPQLQARDKSTVLVKY